MSAGFIFNNEYVDVTHTAPTALGNEGWWWQSSNLNPTRDYILPFGIAPATLTVSDDNNQMLYSTTQSLSSRHYGKLMRAKLIPEDTADFTYTDIVYTKVSDTEFSVSYTEYDVNAGESYNVAITYVLKESAFEMPIENFDLQDKIVNSNGSVTPDQGYYGLGSVNVQVPEVQAILQSKTVTANGLVTPDQGYDGLSSVIVQVPDRHVNLQNKSITSNGTFTADQGYDGLGTVTVNVPTTGNRMYAWHACNNNWEPYPYGNSTYNVIVWSSMPSPNIDYMLVTNFSINNRLETFTKSGSIVTEVLDSNRLMAKVWNNNGSGTGSGQINRYVRDSTWDFTI